jgi:DNA polymerase (family 10)
MENKDPKSNKNIAYLLKSIAAVYLIKNENRFKIIAYQNAADSIEKMTQEIFDIWKDGKLDKVPGIGANLSFYLNEYFKKGYSKHFNSILNKVPPSVFEFMKIPGIGPKKAFKLSTILKIKNKKDCVDKLRESAKNGKIAEIPEFGEKSQESILNSINLYKKKQDFVQRMPLPYAYSQAKLILDYLKNNKNIKRVDLLGSLRRKTETIGDIDISVQVEEKNTKDVINYFLKYPKKIAIDNSGPKKASIIIFPNIRIDLRVQSKKQYGSMLQYLTGSKAHNINLREFALKKGYSLSEYSIKNIKNKKRHYFDNEEKFYNFLKLQYIPPEIREGTNEIQLALENKIPELVDIKDLKGDLHIHSSYDLKPSHDLGRNSYAEILKKATEMGYSYIGFSDHNPKYSNISELDVIEILKKRRNYIQKTLNKFKNKKPEYFIGLEVDILTTGKLAFPKKAVDYVDFLIVAIHSAFNMNKKDMTTRILNGLQHEKVKILAHPTGRLFGKRESYELNWDLLFDYCKSKSIAIEINSWPERLDLSYDLVSTGIKNKNIFAINTDSHAIYHMDYINYGIYVARKAFATKNDIINTYNLNDFRKWIRG